MALPRSRLLLIGLAVVTAGALWRAVRIERERRRLVASYEQAQQAVQELRAEHAHLSEQLAGAQQTIKGQAGDLKSIQDELDQVKRRLAMMVGELASLKQDHEQLRAHDALVNARLNAVLLEKQQLEARLSSLSELKLAIRDIKEKMKSDRAMAWRERLNAMKAEESDRLASGNRGYVMRNGFSTLGSGVRLHVHVLEPQSQ